MLLDLHRSFKYDFVAPLFTSVHKYDYKMEARARAEIEAGMGVGTVGQVEADMAVELVRGGAT